MNIHVEKTVPIEFKQVVDAYGKVRRGGQATGIDNESWTDFEKDVESNLYVIWNRLASGSYFPNAVREVEIPKKDGKMRKLGIPTLRDRIAQQVVKDYMEKRIDQLFHENSYGYRPMKSAHQALDQVRKNSFEYDWVIDMDISKFFDEIDHELMLNAVEHVVEEKWVKMYIGRWLQMPVQTKDGNLRQKEGKGTPQGGVISPLLANLYLHFTLDVWLSKNYPQVRFVRYADDVVIHCQTKEQAELVLKAVRNRLSEVRLAIKEEKTKIAYCKDYRRREKHENVKFDFLGFSYQPRPTKSKFGDNIIMAFTPEISMDNRKRIIQAIKEEHSLKYSHSTLEYIASKLNMKIRGWIQYYGRYGKHQLRAVLCTLDIRLIRWTRKKYKLNTRKATRKLKAIKATQPTLFYHWQHGCCSI